MKIYVGNKHHIRAYLASLHEFGEIPEDFIHFTCRSNSFLPVMIAKLFGLSTARYWTGNDAWRFKNDWTYRVRARFINRFFDRHYFLGWHLLDCVARRDWDRTTTIPTFGPTSEFVIRNLKTPLCYLPKKSHRMPKKETDPVIIGFYDADNSFSNRYGQDLIFNLQADTLDNLNIVWYPIMPNIFKHEDMGQLYNRLDIMVRPSRWDGYDPWMIREAAHYGVKCISTFSQTPGVVKCNPDDYPELLNIVKEAIYEINQKRVDSSPVPADEPPVDRHIDNNIDSISPDDPGRSA